LTLIEDNNGEASSLYKKRAKQEMRNELLALMTINGRERKTRWEETGLAEMVNKEKREKGEEGRTGSRKK
jgi:hypothetical protein